MKRFKFSSLRRMLALLLCLATLLSLAVLPASAAKNTDVLEEGMYATVKNEKIYFNAKHWDTDGAKFAAYFFGNGEAWEWMTKTADGSCYECVAPDNYPNVIFCRMNTSGSLGWNAVWNQTEDLTCSDNTNFFSVNDGEWNKAKGTWRKRIEYVVAGDSALCTSYWAPTDTTNKMTKNSSGLYEITYSDVDVGTYSFKVTDGNWEAEGGFAWGNNGSDYSFTLDNKSNVTITFNPATQEITVTPTMDIYFDATLSKLSYAGGLRNDDNTTYSDKTMPVANATIYCHWWNSSSSGDVKMTLAATEEYPDVYKGAIPANSTGLLFYSSTTGDLNGLTGACVTENQDLTECGIFGMTNPCFYADSSDSTIYTNDDIRREGYWNEAYQLRDAEKEKDSEEKPVDVVDISDIEKKPEADYYVKSTFYDWYTDYELNGGNRDKYISYGAYYSSQRNWVPFRHLNQALSDYYEKNSVTWPLYVGQFQPDEYGTIADSDIPFSKIASTLNLYGWKDSTLKAEHYKDSEDKDQYTYTGPTDAAKYAAYRRFIASNNSSLDTNTSDMNMDKFTMAMQGLVYPNLSNATVPQLLAVDGVEFPLFNKDFITKTNSKNTVLGEVYEDVLFPMDQRDYYGDGVAYYVFNSYDTTLEMVKTSKDESAYSLREVTNTAERARYQNLDAGSNPVTTEDGSSVYGFFPFNSGATPGKASTYNYGFGARFDVDFKLTSTGMVLDKNGNDVPIKFEFSGDDDVWVFIDGNLVLDIGGAHSAVKGTLTFGVDSSNNPIVTSTVYGVKKGGSNSGTEGTKTATYWLDKNKTTHTLTMFYMERGMAESNMELVFNIANSYPATLNVTKEVVDGADPNQVYTMYVTLKNAETHEMEPVAVGTKYTIGSNTYTVETAGQISLKGGETATIVGISVEKYSSYTVEELGEHEVYYFDQIAGSTTVDASSSSATGTLQEATSYNVTVVNAEAEHTVVIDYGIPVSVTVENSNRAALYALCAPGETGWTTSTSTSSSDTTYTGSKYGDAKIENGKIVYTPSNMKMDGVDKIGYVIRYVRDGKTLYYNGTLTVVPAATIYYEDNFVTFNGNWGDKKVPSVTQAEDRPGTGNAYDANNVYGYDGVYSSSTTHSQGYARCTNVSANNGSNPPTATFTFTGTGFDLIGVTSNRTGFATCEVTNSKGKTVRWAVDTYYGFTAKQSGFMKYTWTYNGEDWSVETDVVDAPGNDATKVMPEEPYKKGTTVILYEENYEWTPADPKTPNDLYQIPVIKSPKLDYDTYTVVITPLYAPFFDHTNDSNNSYDFYIDAVRVYNPAQNMDEDYYKLDKEAYPQYIELRQPLVNSSETQKGISLIDGFSAGTIDQYEEFGPNNEIYLNNGHAVAFTLNASGNIANVHVGAKTFSGNGTLTYTIKNSSGTDRATGTINLTSHTDLYYDISKDYTPVSGDMIILSNTGVTTLTLTTLKITYSSAPSATATLTTNTDKTRSAAKYVNALIGSMIDLEVRPLNVHIAHSVSFESNLQLNYRIMQEDLAGYDLNSAYLVVEKDVYPSRGEPSVETYVLYPDLTSDPQRMIFHLAGIKSVEMGNELRATLYIKDELGRKYETAVDVYSILAYAQACFNKYSYEEYPAFYSLLIDTLNYGAAAQVYFNRRTDVLVNAGMDAYLDQVYFNRRTDVLVNAGMDAYQQYATKDFAEELTATKVLLDNANKGLVSKVNFSIDFADRTAMKVKLTLSGSAEEITSVQVTDEEGNTVATLTEFETLADGRIQVTYDGIRAMEMRRMYYFTAYSGEEAASASAGYSVEAYVRSYLGTSLPGLSDLVRYCMYYGDSAEHYFTQRGGESK